MGPRARVRTWAPLAMAAKVDLSTSTNWKEAKLFLKGLSDKQREEHYFCRDFIRLKKIPTWKEMAKGVTVKGEEPPYKKDKQLNEKISLFRGDITKLEVDAIINAANSSLLGGGGGEWALAVAWGHGAGWGWVGLFLLALLFCLPPPSPAQPAITEIERDTRMAGWAPSLLVSPPSEQRILVCNWGLGDT